MSANVPTDVCFSFTGMIQRGGHTGPHRHGWGIVFYEGRGCRAFHDPLPGARSEVARLIERYAIKSCIVISHIRRANRGRVCLANTHPFTRELWGRAWTFAHNGQLKGIKRRALRHYRPIGSTDSEHAFCWLLDQVRQRFVTLPRPGPLRRFIGQLCRELNALGVFNVLLSDSRQTYAFCSNNLTWITRRAPFGEAHLIDAEVKVDFKAVTTEKDIVTIIATRPLTSNEQWNQMQPGTLAVFHQGQVVAH